MNNRLAAVLAALVACGPVQALAQALVITKPATRVAVPVDGQAATTKFSAYVLPYQMVPCGAETHEWRRDGVDAQTCSGSGCSVSYYESAATRGSHVARDNATFWLRPATPYGSCFKMIQNHSRNYVVQYGPTAQLVSAPAALAVNEAASFTFTGTVDPDLSLGPVKYTLDFGDGITRLASSSGYYFYSAPGTYIVTYTVDDGYFKATAQHSVYVYGDQPCSAGEIEIDCL